jgi:hypothetical protein
MSGCKIPEKTALFSNTIHNPFGLKAYEIPSPKQKEVYSIEDFKYLYSEYMKSNNIEEKTPENDKSGLPKEDILKYYKIYDITPKEVKKEIGCQIFKVNYTCETFIVYKSKMFMIGEGFGGYGVVNMETCDFDDDGQKDLIYTFSWGSGLHRSHIGVFNFTEEQEEWLDFQQMNDDIILKKISDDNFKVYTAKISGEDFIHLKLSRKEHVADVISKDGRVGVIKNIN